MDFSRVGLAGLGLFIIGLGALVSISQVPGSLDHGIFGQMDEESSPSLEELHTETAEHRVSGSDGEVNVSYAWTLYDTAVKFNITNHSNKTSGLSLYSEIPGELPREFVVWGKAYHLDIGRVTNLYQYGFLGEPGFIGVHHNEVSAESPVGPTTFIPRGEEWSQRNEIQLSPGLNELVLSAQNVQMDVEIWMHSPVDGSLDIEVAHEDPNMVQHRFSHLEGHWDEVELELWSLYAGHVNASTQLTAEYSYRLISVTASIGLNELKIRDSQGTDCSTNTEPSDLHGAMVRMKPVRGVVSVTGTSTTSGGVPWLILIFYNLPLEFENSWPDCDVFEPGGR